VVIGVFTKHHPGQVQEAPAREHDPALGDDRARASHRQRGQRQPAHQDLTAPVEQDEQEQIEDQTATAVATIDEPTEEQTKGDSKKKKPKDINYFRR